MPLRHRIPPAIAFTLLLLVLPTVSHAAWPHDPTAGVPICVRPGEEQYEPVTVSDGAGGAIILWMDRRANPSDPDIYAQRVDSQGQVLWTADGVVGNNTSVSAIGLVAIPDGAHGVIFGWADNRHGNYDIYAQRLTAAGTRDWSLAGVNVCIVTGHQTAPRIAADGLGGVLVVWNDNRNGNTDIYAQRLNGSGSAQWRTGGAPACSLAAAQDTPDIASDGLGGAYVTWSDYRVGNYDIYAQHLGSTGAYDWTPGGEYVCAATGNQQNPRVVPDGRHDAIIAWEDSRTGSKDIYAQKFQITNYKPWNDNGIAVCTAATGQYDLEMVPTGTEGAILSWTDPRGGNGTDVYAQLIGPGGTPQWTTDGVALCTAIGAQFATGLVADGFGGAIATWEDERTGPFESDVYAQRVSGSGAVQWTANGVYVGGGPVYQLRGSLAADGAGGAIVAYWDHANDPGLGDIRAQRVERFGCLGDPAPALARVVDVRGDQGGQVQVEWTASYLDTFPGLAIAQYSVWRRLPNPSASLLKDLRRAAAAGMAVRAGGGRILRTGAEDATAVYWEQVGTQAARGLPGYSCVAATATDSMTSANPLTSFMVMAERATGVPFWASAADSGYSVDNLAPPAPAPFTGTYAAGTSYLQWGQSPATDFVEFRLHRGTEPGFAPTGANLVVAQASAGYVDAAGGPCYYRLCAVDLHGNVSPYAFLQPAGTVDVSGPALPRELALSAPAPNPLRGSTTLRLALPRAAAVSLAVYDQQGRRVRTLLSGTQPAGERPVAWDGRDDGGRDVASGMYFVRCEVEGRTLTRRIAAIR